MGLIDKIFPVAKAAPKVTVQAIANDVAFQTLTAYEPVFTSWGGALYESELVRSAIDARARHISKLKVEILGNARKKLQTAIKHKPNPWQTWSQFLYRTSTILDMQGTCFIVPILDEYRDTIGLFPVLPERCELRELNGALWLRYSFGNGQNAAVEFDKCAVLTWHQYKDDFFGTGNRALTETMELIHLNSQGVSEAVKSGATYRFMAQLNNFSTADDLAEERRKFTEKNFSSEAEGGGLLLFPSTYKDIRQINNQAYTVDANQMQLIRTNVYNYFGVNEDILQNKAFGDAWSAFYEGCVEVFAIQFSEALSGALFTDRERSGEKPAAIMATANRLQYMSNADKLAVSRDLADRGVLSRNEVREIWNMAPVEGGDVFVIRGEYYNADDKVSTTTQEGGSTNE